MSGASSSNMSKGQLDRGQLHTLGAGEHLHNDLERNNKPKSSTKGLEGHQSIPQTRFKKNRQESAGSKASNRLVLQRCSMSSADKASGAMKLIKDQSQKQ